MTNTKTISGHSIKLANGGEVWMSDENVTNSDGATGRAVRFRNGDGIISQMMLSSEALYAMQILHDPTPTPTKRFEDFVDGMMFEFKVMDEETGEWKRVEPSPENEDKGDD